MAKCSNFSEIEGKIPLKRCFQLAGNDNMVPVSESPTYPGYHLSEVFLLKFYKEAHGVPLIDSILEHHLYKMPNNHDGAF